MDKIWLRHYPQGVPAEINPRQYASLKEVFEKSCARFGDLPAFTNMDATLSYAQLDRLSRDFGAYLQHSAGLKKSDRVAIMMPNLLQYPVALFGALRAGMTVVNVNPLYTPRELQYQLADSGARAIVVLENFAGVLQEVIHKTAVETVVTTQVGDMLPFARALLVNFVVKHVKRMVPDWNIELAADFRAALSIGSRHALQDVELSAEDIAFLQYTGGTTGVAKGAILTHGNMVANLEQAYAWISKTLEEGKETVITALPLYHVFALTANLLTFFKIGAHNVLITNPRDIEGFVKELKKVPFTVITGVNTLFNALLNAPGFGDVATGAIKVSLGGGAAVQRAVAERWKKRTGMPLIEAYGLTETAPAACINPLDAKEYSGSIGLPISSTEVSIRDDAGNEVPLGEVGEICIRGPQVMKGYWNRPDETARVLSPEHWLRTGDMGYMDPRGFVKLVDRKKDMIIVSGFNVYPNEVEEVVASCPGVLEVGAIGVSDAKSGEAIKVFVVKQDATLTAKDVIEHCRKQLTAYKVPKHVEFRDQLPKTPIGKILRRMLKDEEAAKAKQPADAMRAAA